MIQRMQYILVSAPGWKTNTSWYCPALQQTHASNVFNPHVLTWYYNVALCQKEINGEWLSWLSTLPCGCSGGFNSRILHPMYPT